MNTWFELGRQTVRRVVRHPLHSLFSIMTLAVAIGGGTLLFSLYDAIALRELPVEDPQELVSIRVLSVDDAGRTANFGRLSLDEVEELSEAAMQMADPSAFATGEVVLRAGERAERAQMHWVDPNYFSVLGVGARRGRVFTPGDDPRKGGDGGVVLTETAWRRWFGDEELGSQTVEVDGVAAPVIGVVPGEFRGFEVGADPALFGLASEVPDNWAFFRMFARLAPSMSSEQLEAKLSGVFDAMRARDVGRQSFMIIGGKSSKSTERIQVVDGSRGESELRGDATLPIALVGGLLFLVLGVLAANLANLLAVRALSERGGAAIRIALGAPRGVIAASWLAESLLVTLTGAALGMAIVAQSAETLLSWAPLPRWADGLTPVIDLRTIGIAVGLAIGVAVIVGGIAALEQARVSPHIRLREESPTSSQSRTRVRWRNALVVSQVALSFVLLVAMGLFVRSAAELLDIDTGFPLERVGTFRLDLPESLAEETAGDIERLRSELSRTPGVIAVGFSATPILGGVRGYRMGSVEGYQPAPDEVMMLNTLHVSPGFFEALEMPLASGRFPKESDLSSRSAAIVVNRRFADHYLSGADVIGRRISFNFQRDWSEPQSDDLVIVGVVDDRMISEVREEPTPRLYPLVSGAGTVNFYVRTTSDPTRLGPEINRRAQEILPQAAIGAFHTLADQRDRSLRRELVTRDLTIVFGGLALLLAAMGLFAVISYLVGERRRELGLRQALGASPRDLASSVFLDGLRPVAWGLGIGLPIATYLSGFAASQLYGVEARDPLTFLVAVLVMGAVAVIACIPAAIRASRTDAAQALRS